MEKDNLDYYLMKLKMLSSKKNTICLIGWIYFSICILAYSIGAYISPLYYKDISVDAGDIMDVNNRMSNEFLLNLIPLACIILWYWFVSRSYNKLENKIEKGLR